MCFFSAGMFVSMNGSSLFKFAIGVLCFLAFLSLCKGQCCSVVPGTSGYCPSGSGVSIGSQCSSCSSVTTGSCSCGGGACYSSQAACDSACALTTTTSSTAAPTTTPAAPSGSYYSIYVDSTNACQPGCEMHAGASASLSGSILSVTFQGSLTGMCNGQTVSRAVSSLSITNVVALSSAGYYQGTLSGTSSIYCFYLDSHLLALPNQPNACPGGPPFRDSCSIGSNGVASLLDVLVFSTPAPTQLPTTLPSGSWTASLRIPVISTGSCSSCVIDQAITIVPTGSNSLSLTAGAVTNNPCSLSASAYPSFTMSITNIVTRESSGYFFGTNASSGAQVCFIYISGVFMFGYGSCPTGPFRSYCGTGASTGAVISYAFAQTGPSPTGPPISTTTSSSTTSPSSSKTVWSGSYSVNAGCSQSQCCCVVGSFTMTQTGTQVTGTVSVAGQCGGATSAPFSVTLSSPTATSGTWGQNNLVKDGATVTATNTANSACSATLTCTSGDCLPSSTTCFHESTSITYKGETYKLSDFTSSSLNHPKLLEEECRVPHIVEALGVTIETAGCGSSASSKKKMQLRLTGDHLVYTGNKGLIAASSVAVGDVVFGDVHETQQCVVTAVIQDKVKQRFFGLNCRESVVLANGIKTSTFGRYHTVPAAWMSWVGSVFGMDRASRWGDSMAEFLAKIKAI